MCETILYGMISPDVPGYHTNYELVRRVYDPNGIAPTVTAHIGGNTEIKVIMENECRVRRLTPKECWRLMSFDDADYEKAKAAGVSDTQLYRQAGNSICVDVLCAILKKMCA